MDFRMDKEHLLLQQMYREFVEKEVAPLAAEVDETEEAPMATVEKLAKYGFLGIPNSKEYGGQGGDYIAYVMAVEELARACATTSVIVSAHTSLGVGAIYENGTKEQKEKYLPDLLSGKKIGTLQEARQRWVVTVKFKPSFPLEERL